MRNQREATSDDIYRPASSMTDDSERINFERVFSTIRNSNGVLSRGKGSRETRHGDVWVSSLECNVTTGEVSDRVGPEVWEQQRFEPDNGMTNNDTQHGVIIGEYDNHVGVLSIPVRHPTDDGVNLREAVENRVLGMEEAQRRQVNELWNNRQVVREVGGREYLDEMRNRDIERRRLQREVEAGRHYGFSSDNKRFIYN